MENSKNTRVITLKDLWEVFLRCVWFMLAAAILVGGVYLVVDKATFKPQYASTARVFLAKEYSSSGSGSSAEDINKYTLGLKLVYDCTYMLKSNSVVEQTIQKLGLDISYGALRNNISVNNPTDTRFLEVTVKADSPEQAKSIVDTLCSFGVVKINDTMGYQQVSNFEDGLVSSVPCNRTGTVTYVLVALVAAVFVYVVFLLMFFLDDSLRTEEDIERYLGLSVLGDIPDAFNAKHKRSGYRYVYQYGYGRRSGAASDAIDHTEG